jgi:hypothetical protein
MRSAWNVIVFVVATACLLAAKPGSDVTGTWDGQLRGQDGGTGSVRFVLKQEGNRISGTAGPVDEKNPGQVYDGKLDGSHLMFAADDTAKDGSGLSLTYNFDLTITGDQMQGKAHGYSGNRSWTLDISLTRRK